MKTNRIMTACGICMIAAFSLFVVVYQAHVRQSALVQIRDHAAVVASSLWTFEKSSPTAYLTLAAKAGGYERILVVNDRGTVFLDIRSAGSTRADDLLGSLGLIPVYPLEAAILFEGKRIGTISALWPCRAIYRYLYILLCLVLALPGIWFFLKLVEAKRTLEIRVRERTEELERENSERRRAEEALRVSEERLRMALDGTSDGIWDWNLETGQAYFSPRYYTMAGYEPDEFPACYESWQRLIHPDDMEATLATITRAIDRCGQFAVEFRFKAKKSGEWRWILGRGKVAETDGAGKALRLAGSHTDITQRKTAEEALRKYERIVSATRDIMALVSAGGVYEAVNESFLTAHQIKRNEVVGRTIPEMLGERVYRERVGPLFAQALAGETVRYRIPLQFAGLGARIMDVTYFPVFDDKGAVEAIVVNARDVTDTLKLEEQLVQSQRIESIGTLAGGVAHEINNPINGIMNYAQLVLDSLEEGHVAGRFAGEIIHETERIAMIVRNLLTFARNERQSHSPAQLSDIVSAVLSLIQTVMRHDQIVLEVDIPEGLPKFKCRSQQIQQVLMNLLTNARDSLNERYGGFSPEKKIRVTASLIDKAGRRFIRTTVEDHGIGIRPEIRERIFDPFFTTKPKETGTGLGLSISYGIVRDHGGELIVESEPGCYARFHMDLRVDNGWSLSEKPENGAGPPSPG